MGAWLTGLFPGPSPDCPARLLSVVGRFSFLTLLFLHTYVQACPSVQVLNGGDSAAQGLRQYLEIFLAVLTRGDAAGI